MLWYYNKSKVFYEGNIMKNGPKGEMSEKNLLEILKIFIPAKDWTTQKRFKYDPDNKRKFYQVDAVSILKNIIWEYEGPDHYENVWKLKRDNERKLFFENEGFKFCRWPYFVQLTKDIAKHYFKENYSDRKYKKAIQLVYGSNKEEHILAPGFHTTKNTPANFVAKGTRRFIRELNILPRSLKHQVVNSIKLYIKEVDDPYLVIGEGPAYKKLLKTKCEKKYLSVYYHYNASKNIDFNK